MWLDLRDNSDLKGITNAFYLVFDRHFCLHEMELFVRKIGFLTSCIEHLHEILPRGKYNSNFKNFRLQSPVSHVLNLSFIETKVLVTQGNIHNTSRII